MRTVFARHRAEILAGAALAAVLASGLGAYGVRDGQQRRAVAVAMTGGDPALAPAIFRRYGCTGCHSIPGISGADGKVGGPLTALRERVYIAGELANTPENLIQWIVVPQRFSPKTAMPATGVSQDEARHLAAYLYAD